MRKRSPCAVTHTPTCTGRGREEELMYVVARVCVCVCVSGDGGGGDVGLVTSKVLGHSPPLPPLPPPSFSPPPSTGMWLKLMMSLHFCALTVSAPLQGQGTEGARARGGELTCSIHPPSAITTLGSAFQTKSGTAALAFTHLLIEQSAG